MTDYLTQCNAIPAEKKVWRWRTAVSHKTGGMCRISYREDHPSFHGVAVDSEYLGDADGTCDSGRLVRLITDPATLRDCWHCGRVMERGQVDSMGRDWCGCVEHLPTQVVSDGSIRVKEIQGVEVVSKLAEFPKTKGA